jgi:hypothetical protein
MSGRVGQPVNEALEAKSELLCEEGDVLTTV